MSSCAGPAGMRGAQRRPRPCSHGAWHQRRWQMTWAIWDCHTWKQACASPRRSTTQRQQRKLRSRRATPKT
eukprot:12934412-Prorocentrum_lima.AAC.1